MKPTRNKTDCKNPWSIWFLLKPMFFFFSTLLPGIPNMKIIKLHAIGIASRNKQFVSQGSVKKMVYEAYNGYMGHWLARKRLKAKSSGVTGTPATGAPVWHKPVTCLLRKHDANSWIPVTGIVHWHAYWQCVTWPLYELRDLFFLSYSLLYFSLFL